MKVRVYATLRPLVGGSSVTLDGGAGTVGEVLARLVVAHPALQDRLFDEEGAVRPFVAIMVGGRDIRHLQRLETAVQETDELDIFPPVAGG